MALGRVAPGPLLGRGAILLRRPVVAGCFALSAAGLLGPSHLLGSAVAGNRLEPTARFQKRNPVEVEVKSNATNFGGLVLGCTEANFLQVIKFFLLFSLCFPFFLFFSGGRFENELRKDQAR